MAVFLWQEAHSLVFTLLSTFFWTHGCVLVTGSTFTSAYISKHIFFIDNVTQIFQEPKRRLNLYSCKKHDIISAVYFGTAVLADLYIIYTKYSCTRWAFCQRKSMTRDFKLSKRCYWLSQSFGICRLVHCYTVRDVWKNIIVSTYRTVH
jgi:hypothetical protein